MSEKPHADLLQHAPAARKDFADAQQLFGALETLVEKVPADPVVAVVMPQCRTFCVLMRQLTLELDALAAAADGAAVEIRPAKAQALVEEWQATRRAFRDAAARNKEYLEKLALTIYR